MGNQLKTNRTFTSRLLTNRPFGIIMRTKIVKDIPVGPLYKIGQKVIIRPVKEQPLSSRECNIESYAGQIAKVSNYFWISPPAGNVLYIYTVKLGADEKELVLHEDEMETCIT